VSVNLEVIRRARAGGRLHLPKGLGVPRSVLRTTSGRPVLLGLTLAVLLTAAIALGSGPATFGVSLAILGAAVVSPPVGFAVLVLIAPLQPPTVVPAPGLNALLAGAVILGCIYRLPIDRPRLQVGMPLALLGAFIAYVGVQQLPEMLGGYSGDVGHLVGYQFVQLLTGFAVVVAAGYVLRDRDPRPYLAAGLASAAVAAVLAIATYDASAVPSPLANLLANSEQGVRASGPFGNPNYFGVFQAVAATTAIGWLASARSRWSQLFLGGAAGIGTVALALTMSRGAIVALLVGIITVAIVRSKVRGAVVAGAILVAALAIYPAFIQWRLGASSGTAGQALADLAASDAERAAAVLAGPRIFATAPVFGVGFGHYSFVSAEFSGNTVATAAHDWYMNVLAEEGLVGVVLWGLLLVAVALALRRRPAAARTIGFGVFAALASGSLFLEPPTSFQTTALPAVVITAALVADWAGGGSREDGAARVAP
jgi:O-antigen ligase